MRLIIFHIKFIILGRTFDALHGAEKYNAERLIRIDTISDNNIAGESGMEL